MIPTLSTTTLGGAPEQKLRAAAGAGFHGVELFSTDLDLPGATTASLKRAAADAGIAITDYFPLRDFEGMPDAARPAALDQAARFLDTAAELGAGMVMACSNVHPDSLGDPERIAADLSELGDLADQRGLVVAYEALAWGRHVFDYRDALALVRRAAHPRIGLVLDTFHVLARGIETDTIRTIRADEIFLVQVSDAPMLDTDYLSWSRGHRILPGQGALDLTSFADAVAATGYRGVVSLECFNDGLRQQPPDRVAREAFAALADLWPENPDRA